MMNMTSAPFERRTDSLAVKQALESETVVGSRKERKKRKELYLLPPLLEFISACQDSCPE